MKILTNIWAWIIQSDNLPLLKEIGDLQSQNKAFSSTINQLNNDKLNLITMNTVYMTKIEELKNKEQSTIEKFCDNKYKKIPNIAYKNKRDINGIMFNVFLNEFMTPDAWEVINIKRNLDMTGNIANTARLIGNVISANTTWTNDTNLSTSGEYYLYPAEIIALKKGDCEDIAFVTGSFSPEIVCAYGYYINSKKEELGHAFNVFVFANRLFILDSGANEAVIKEYVENVCGYRIHFIITKNYTYQVRGENQFGFIAGWD